MTNEVISAVVGVPREIRNWWHDSHHWDRPTHDIVFSHNDYYMDEKSDFRMWHKLGVVSDMLIILIVALIFIMIGLA